MSYLRAGWASPKSRDESDGERFPGTGPGLVVQTTATDDADVVAAAYDARLDDPRVEAAQPQLLAGLGC